MPTRREFLRGTTVTLIMIPIGACSSGSSSSSSPDAGGGNPGSGCNGILTTSSNVSQHTHTLCVPTTDLTNPPGAGNTYTSSSNLDPLNNQNHTHTVTLSAAQLATIQGGASVTVTSSNNDSHTHDFAIMKM
jgi:hypothetical protein